VVRGHAAPPARVALAAAADERLSTLTGRVNNWRDEFQAFY
jgi:hypothetical protein